MKEFIFTIFSAYLIIGGLSIFVANIARMNESEKYCKVIVADYLFLGLTRLPSEVK